MSGEIVVPSVGESINEVVVSRWLVEVGAYVAVDTPVVSLETDKATVDYEAVDEGFLAKILFEEGSVPGPMTPSPSAMPAAGAWRRESPRTFPTLAHADLPLPASPRTARQTSL